MNPFGREVESDNKQEYYRFLQSEEWAAIRERVLARDRHRCTVCGCRNDLQVHHVSYHDAHGRKDWTNPGVMITLCRPCHEIITGAVEQARALRVEIPALSVPLYRLNDENFAKYLRDQAKHNLYGMQQNLAAETIFKLYRRSLRADARPINICDCETHRHVAVKVLLTLEHQAGWYADWLNVNTKSATDALVVKYRAEAYNHYKTAGHSERDIQQFLGLNDAQMAKVRKNAQRLIGADGGG